MIRDFGRAVILWLALMTLYAEVESRDDLILNTHNEMESK